MKKAITITTLLCTSISCFAATEVSTTKASAQLSNSCQISVSNISIGEIKPGEASATGSAPFTIKCTKSTAYRYYIGYWQWGVDCSYLEGDKTKDRILYGILNKTTGESLANNMTGTAPTGLFNNGTGDGQVQRIELQATIQPTWGGSTCPTPYIAPGKGFNPFASPDNYSDRIVFGVVY